MFILKNLVRSSHLLISNQRVRVFRLCLCRDKLQYIYKMSPSHVCFYFSTVFCWQRQPGNFSRTSFTFCLVCCEVPPQPLPSCFLFYLKCSSSFFLLVLRVTVFLLPHYQALSLSGDLLHRSWSHWQVLHPVTGRAAVWLIARKTSLWDAVGRSHRRWRDRK